MSQIIKDDKKTLNDNIQIFNENQTFIHLNKDTSNRINGPKKHGSMVYI